MPNEIRNQNLIVRQQFRNPVKAFQNIKFAYLARATVTIKLKGGYSQWQESLFVIVGVEYLLHSY